MTGDFASASRKVTNVPVLTNLLADPFQTARKESPMAKRWAADQAWLLVPIQVKVKAFMATLGQYPFQEGVSLNPGNINYQSLAVKKALMGLHKPATAN
jgi:arylsulfatase